VDEMCGERINASLSAAAPSNSARCRAQPSQSSPPNRVSSRQVQVGRLCRNLRYRFWGPFGLCGRMLSLVSISMALSPHPKIPFLADKAQRLTSGFCRIGARPRRRWQRRFFGVRYCSGFNPSASNCRLHSGGASRSRSMLMLRGKRPRRRRGPAWEQERRARWSNLDWRRFGYQGPIHNSECHFTLVLFFLLQRFPHARTDYSFGNPANLPLGTIREKIWNAVALPI
jgi:hypothetical protein